MLNNGMVYVLVVKNTRGKTLKTIIRSKVIQGSILVSDGWVGYRGLEKEYNREVIKHNLNIFKKGPYHTNGIEGFWSILKRGIIECTISLAKNIYIVTAMSLHIVITLEL